MTIQRISRRAACAFVVSIGVVSQVHAQSLTEDLKAKAQQVIAPLTGKTDDRLKEVATFDHQVTGVTVSEDGRIFVNFPRWTEDVPYSVAEVMKDGSVKPYPNEQLNAWRNARMSELSPRDHFVCVQSVVADGKGTLWVVDPAAPNAEKIIKGGPKLVAIDLASNNVKKTYPIDESVAGPASYLNDVRIAPDGRFAYMTDSGMPGGLVVVNLESGKAWRVLSGDPSTQFDPKVTVKTDGKPLRRPDGRQPIFNADGIALSADGNTLFWQAVTGMTLYKTDTRGLQQEGGNVKAEKVADTEPVDGLWIDKSGRIYLSSIADNAVKVLDPTGGASRPLITDSRLRWPDTFAQGPDGAMYVTASHIQDSPWFHMAWTSKNFALFKFDPEQSTTGSAPK